MHSIFHFLVTSGSAAESFIFMMDSRQDRKKLGIRNQELRMKVAASPRIYEAMPEGAI